MLANIWQLPRTTKQSPCRLRVRVPMDPLTPNVDSPARLDDLDLDKLDPNHSLGQVLGKFLALIVEAWSHGDDARRCANERQHLTVPSLLSEGVHARHRLLGPRRREPFNDRLSETL